MRTLLVAVTVLLGVTLQAPSRGDLTAEVVTRCKHATAFVLVGEDEASAFHIGSGLFVTNSHVVEDIEAGTKIKLILDAGESAQKTVSATLLRANAKSDLALLRIEEEKLPPSLQLGSSAALIETAPIAAFGYPFGKDLAVGNAEFPNITVSMGRITSLRKENGRIRRIQIDASLNPGNSGGPIVDGSGQVIGVVETGIVGTGVSFAIPIDDLRAFLFGATIVIHAPALQKAASDRADNIGIDIITQGERPADLSVSLTLSAHIEDKRTFKAADTGNGHFTVSAALLPPAEHDMLEAVVEDRDSNWSIRVKDRMVQVAGRTVHLSTIREITLGSAPMVVFASGQRTAASVLGLKSLETRKNGKPSTIDLSGAQVIRLSPSEITVKAVHYDIVATSGAKVVAKQDGTIGTDGVVPNIVVAKQAEEIAEKAESERRLSITIGDAEYVTSTQHENLTASFAQPDGGVTLHSYAGYVLVSVGGVGQAYSPVYNDAFYLFTDQFSDPKNGHDGGFYQLTFGTGPLTERNLGANAKNFLVGELPPYDPSHIYTFVLDTKTDTPARLHFGVSDGGYDDNTGAYYIRVTQLVPARK